MAAPVRDPALYFIFEYSDEGNEVFLRLLPDDMQPVTLQESWEKRQNVKNALFFYMTKGTMITEVSGLRPPTKVMDMRASYQSRSSAPLTLSSFTSPRMSPPTLPSSSSSPSSSPSWSTTPPSLSPPTVGAMRVGQTMQQQPTPAAGASSLSASPPPYSPPPYTIPCKPPMPSSSPSFAPSLPSSSPLGQHPATHTAYSPPVNTMQPLPIMSSTPSSLSLSPSHLSPYHHPLSLSPESLSPYSVRASNNALPPPPPPSYFADERGRASSLGIALNNTSQQYSQHQQDSRYSTLGSAQFQQVYPQQTQNDQYQQNFLESQQYQNYQQQDSSQQYQQQYQQQQEDYQSNNNPQTQISEDLFASINQISSSNEIIGQAGY
eukprot:TRINITY_DN569_c0_g1_i1.p1 TRINITY_DN569_c0_g1~~TRINITY_DN569_c0_g1_i1.p1  ORF type:complete len:377 (-),score=110.38 TRINITY_DN569_c0_g1_i1:796-1926(-)